MSILPNLIVYIDYEDETIDSFLIDFLLLM